jgi:hypothetical protein
MWNKRNTAALFVAALVMAGSDQAVAKGAYTGSEIGLGLTLGSPTGFDAKFGLGGGHAIDTTLGVHFLGHDFLGIGVEYNYALYGFRAGPTSNSLYLGAGAILTLLNHHVYHGHHGHDDDASIGLGVKVPFGVDFVFDRAPINLFFEIGPGFVIASHHGFGLLFDVAVGIRFML